MKANFKLNLGNITTTIQGQEVNIKDISAEASLTFTLKDLIDSYPLFKEMIKDGPSMIEDLYKSYEKLEEIQNEEIISNPVALTREDLEELEELKTMPSRQISEEEMISSIGIFGENIVNALKKKTI